MRVQDLRKTHGVLPTVHKQVVLLIQRTIEVVALSEHRILPSFIMCYPSFNGMVRYCHSNSRSHIITFSYSQVFMVQWSTIFSIRLAIPCRVPPTAKMQLGSVGLLGCIQPTALGCRSLLRCEAGMPGEAWDQPAEKPKPITLYHVPCYEKSNRPRHEKLAMQSMDQNPDVFLLFSPQDDSGILDHGSIPPNRRFLLPHPSSAPAESRSLTCPVTSCGPPGGGGDRDKKNRVKRSGK